MKTQIRGLAAALAVAVSIAVVATADSSAAPINGTSIKAGVLTGMTEVRYRVRRSHPYPQHWSYPAFYSGWGYPAYGSYWGYPTDESYDAAYDYGHYRSGCLPGPRVGAFATAPWTDTPTCAPY
ncbi:hypothetical protein [Bradyrhizobium sp. B117]|uniref:hypothetical protein n=1 Tax=Bradyrhizobium sp. B117 TaxID=3140246 RepID=UPI003184048E